MCLCLCVKLHLTKYVNNLCKDPWFLTLKQGNEQVETQVYTFPLTAVSLVDSFCFGLSAEISMPRVLHVESAHIQGSAWLNS